MKEKIQGILLKKGYLNMSQKLDNDIKQLKGILQMILDSRTDIETWIIEAFYKIKSEEDLI